MIVESATLIELVTAGIGGAAAIGITILKMALRGIEQQTHATRELIEEKFKWAEAQRQEAGGRWEKHFERVETNQQHLEQRLDDVENRISHLEHTRDRL